MGDRQRCRRSLLGATAAAVVAFGLGACSSGSTADTQITPLATLAPASTLAAATATTAGAPTTVAAAATTVAAPAPEATQPAAAAPGTDGAALLEAAVAGMSAGYHFTTTLTIDGAVVLTADGDRVGDGSRLAVTQGDASVQYVITPAGTWVLPDDGEWQQLDADTAATDPIAALAMPTTVAIESSAGTATTVAATVPAASLGLPGDAPVTVSATIDNGAITTVGYATSVEGKPATMQASIGAVVDATPVVAPV